MRSLREDAIRMFDDSYSNDATFESVYGAEGVPEDGIADEVISTPATEMTDPVMDVAVTEPLTLTADQVSALNAAIATIQGILGSSAMETDDTSLEDDAAIMAEDTPAEV